jgi:hypothetical protein
MPSARALAAAAALAVAASPGLAAAIDRFEIQVYQSDINEPGQLGLELHLNYTAQGTKEPEWDGQVPPWHAFRTTLEPAIGVTEWLELGAYLQFLTAPGGVAEFGGWKLRAKLVLPERISGSWMLGLNVELSNVPIAVEQERWANEFRPILGWHGERWLVSVNPIVGWSLTGPDAFRPDLEPCGKVAWDTRLGFSIGAEYYSSLGFVNDLLPRDQQEHLLFAVVDLVPRAPEPPHGSPSHASEWELNLGIGGALTDAPGPHVLVKAIVGRSF